MAFEQAGGSMNIFAKDYTSRILSGSAATIFFWVNAMLTVVPLALITWVLLRLVVATKSRIPLSNASIVLSFILIWVIAIWMLNKEYNMRAYEIAIEPTPPAGSPSGAPANLITTNIQSDLALQTGQKIHVVDIEGKGGSGKIKVLTDEQAAAYTTDVEATVTKEMQNETEVTATWFQILNSFFIIALAPLFTRIWESRLNPSAPVKFGIGLVLLGLGFGVLALGSMGIKQGAATAQVSMWWLIFAFLFHTLGELCVSPVGLSYVSKLAPARLVGLMFGIWFLASAIANYLAGWTGSYIDAISEKFGLSAFFLIYTIIPIAAGVVILVMTRMIRKKMHGID